MDNFIEIHKFKNHFGESFMDSKGNLRFNARIIYCWDSNRKEESLSVTIYRNGFEDGRIQIEDGSILTSGRFHLDFDTEYQNYQFIAATGALIVNGQSLKMNGDYNVEIIPI